MSKLPSHPFDRFKNDAPCMECNDRHVGCHGKCEKYKDYAQKHAEEKAILRANRMQGVEPESYALDRHYKIKKRTDRKRRQR